MARLARLRAAVPFLVATICAGALLQLLQNRTQVFLFQARDLARARALLAGNIPWFGPELSGDGNLPGNFYYLLLALPTTFVPGWRGAWMLSIALASVAIGLMVSFLWRRFGAFPALLSVVFLLPASDYAQNLTLFMNPAFLPFFVVAVLLSFTLAVADGDDGARVRWWLGACLVLGFAVQVHMSILLLFPAAALCWLRAPRPKVGRWAPLAMGVGLFLVPLLPYFAWRLAGALGHPFGLERPSYPGLAGGPDRAFLLQRLWVRFSHPQAGSFPTDSFAFWSAILSPSLLGALPFALRARSRTPEPDGFARRARRFWGICVLFATPSACVQLFIGRYARYDFLFLLVFPFFAAATAHSWLRDRRARDWALLFAAALGAWEAFAALQETFAYHPQPLAMGLMVMAAALPLAARFVRRDALVLPLTVAGVSTCVVLLSGQFKSNRGPELPDLADFQTLADEVVERTGWNFEEARDRIFFVNVRNELAPEVFFRTDPKSFPAGKRRPDGFFFAWMEGTDRDRKDIDQWLLEQRLHPDIKAALRDGRLRLGIARRTRTGFVVPYFSLPDEFPEGFHNLGRPYDVASSRPPRPGPNTAIFNDCPNGDERCAFSLAVELARNGRLRIRVSGPTLSLPTLWVSYNWIEQLRDVFLEARCSPGSAPKRVPVTRSVGLFTVPLEQVNNRSILAPFVRSVPNPCDREPISVRLGYGSAMVIRRLQKAEFPGKSTELPFDPVYALPRE